MLYSWSRFFFYNGNAFADSDLIVVLRKKNVTVMFMGAARSRLDIHHILDTIPCKMNEDMRISFAPIGRPS